MTTRDLDPQGVSPQDEWHGPYEVVHSPRTGGYFVVDNADRAATVLPLSGFKTLEAAQRSRDYIDERRAGKERAKALADAVFDDVTDALDPGSTPDSRRSDSVITAAGHLADLYGEPAAVQWDRDGWPYMRFEAPDGSGWFLLDRGKLPLLVRHAADPEHDQAVLHVATSSTAFPPVMPAGWGCETATAALTEWVRENGADYARNSPAISAWQQRRANP